jgi:hypothetical protein
VNHPSFRPTGRPLWLIVHVGQCGPKIVEIGSFCNHGSNPRTYRRSWAIQKRSLKAAHHVNPQRTRTPSQEKVRTHSYPSISSRPCRRCLNIKSYCRHAVLIAFSHSR